MAEWDGGMFLSPHLLDTGAEGFDNEGKECLMSGSKHLLENGETFERPYKRLRSSYTQHVPLPFHPFEQVTRGEAYPCGEDGSTGAQGSMPYFHPINEDQVLDSSRTGNRNIASSNRDGSMVAPGASAIGNRYNPYLNYNIYESAVEFDPSTYSKPHVYPYLDSPSYDHPSNSRSPQSSEMAPQVPFYYQFSQNRAMNTPKINGTFEMPFATEGNNRIAGIDYANLVNGGTGIDRNTSVAWTSEVKSPRINLCAPRLSPSQKHQQHNIQSTAKNNSNSFNKRLNNQVSKTDPHNIAAYQRKAKNCDAHNIRGNNCVAYNTDAYHTATFNTTAKDFNASNTTVNNCNASMSTNSTSEENRFPLRSSYGVPIDNQAATLGLNAPGNVQRALSGYDHSHPIFSNPTLPQQSSIPGTAFLPAPRPFVNLSEYPLLSTNVRLLGETLHHHAARGYCSKIELKDISIYDHTPAQHGSNTSRAHRNEFIVNYGGSNMNVQGKAVDVCAGGTGGGQKCTLYYLDIPNHRASEPTRWIYFQISRPLLSIQNVPNQRQGGGTSGLHQFMAPDSDKMPTGFVQIATSTSWVVFACPLSNVKQMGTSKETIFWDVSDEQKNKVEGKKVEFQFCTGGDHAPSPLPCFEFSGKGKVDGRLIGCGVLEEGEENDEWFSLNGVEPFVHENDGSMGMTDLHERSYEAQQDWHRKLLIKRNQDVALWGRIRDMMANGTCRIVARYEEEKKESCAGKDRKKGASAKQ